MPVWLISQEPWVSWSTTPLQMMFLSLENTWLILLQSLKSQLLFLKSSKFSKQKQPRESAGRWLVPGLSQTATKPSTLSWKLSFFNLGSASPVHRYWNMPLFTWRCPYHSTDRLSWKKHQSREKDQLTTMMIYSLVLVFLKNIYENFPIQFPFDDFKMVFLPFLSDYQHFSPHFSWWITVVWCILKTFAGIIYYKAIYLTSKSI